MKSDEISTSVPHDSQLKNRIESCQFNRKSKVSVDLIRLSSQGQLCPLGIEVNSCPRDMREIVIIRLYRSIRSICRHRRANAKKTIEDAYNLGSDRPDVQLRVCLWSLRT